MKNFKKFFIGIFIGYFTSMGISVLGAFFYSIPINYYFDSKNNLAYFIINFTVVLISMFVFFYIEGYKLKIFDFKALMISLVVFLALLIIVVYIIGRAVYVSGPTDYLVHYVLLDLKPDFLVNKKIYNLHCLVAMVISYIFFYAPIMVTALYLGNKKYKKEYSNKTSCTLNQN